MKINIIEYFIDTVNVANNKIAVIDGDQNVSFSELNAKAKRIAYEIIRLNNCINKPIAVFLPKSIESVVADIAIIYSGNCYMNLDVKYPQARLKNIIEQVSPQFIITSSAYSSALEALGSHATVINMDMIDVDINFNEEKLRSNVKRIIDTDPLCIINTSGSTGTPKGVVLNHRSFFDFTEWAVETLGITDHEIVGSLSPSIFDIYSFELCMQMAKGSTLVLIPEQNSAFPATILDIMQKNEVSFIFWVPTIMVNIANMDLLSKIALPKLKTVWFAGEVFPTKQFNYWKKNLQGTKFVNLYGPIEITLDCTYYIVERDMKDEEPIPIGCPCRNTDILVLKENDQPAGINQSGTGPLRFELKHCYPNPANPLTRIPFSLAVAGPVRLSLRNLLGEEVALLAEGPMTAGAHEVAFDASRLPTGVYLYALQQEARQQVRKLLVLK